MKITDLILSTEEFCNEISITYSFKNMDEEISRLNDSSMEDIIAAQQKHKHMADLTLQMARDLSNCVDRILTFQHLLVQLADKKQKEQ